ncbi:efflux RND transporter permease subunit, partial [Klebsiella pneumoniae]|nr:efflux RND transporter permease subunit [Klebsiella pneumoniae]
MAETLSGLGVGLALAILPIFLLLTANFESVRLSLVVIATVPAILCGVELALWITQTTINVQSFMGA